MAGVKGFKGQIPLREGESSDVTSVRLTDDLARRYDDLVEKLRKGDYPDVTKSAVMRAILEFYIDYAEVAFKKRNPIARDTFGRRLDKPKRQMSHAR